MQQDSFMCRVCDRRAVVAAAALALFSAAVPPHNACTPSSSPACPRHALQVLWW